jgi:Amidohydrolase family
MLDVIIRGGDVVDGTGAPGRRADVGIKGGRIVHVGEVGQEAATVVDAAGKVVAPGFVDIHTHYDAQVFWDPALTPSCFHGVTTVIGGNCGFSIAPTRLEHHAIIAATLERVEDMNVDTLAAGIPWDFETFPEYLASVERHGVGLNFGAYLVCRVADSLAISCDGGEDLIGGLVPDVGAGVFVPVGGPVPDVTLEGPDAGMGSSFDLFGGQLGEPSFHHVEP